YTEANVYSVQKDYTRWQFDQRRYKPFPYRDSNESTNGLTESKKDFYRKQEKNEVLAMPEKLSKNNDLEGVAQSLRKDIFKDISLRERLFERLKNEFYDVAMTLTKWRLWKFTPVFPQNKISSK
ncbi:MAG: hypothetical protein ACK415_13180, partial [Thermodesulfovibrionales bacterium]